MKGTHKAVQGFIQNDAGLGVRQSQQPVLLCSPRRFASASRFRCCRARANLRHDGLVRRGAEITVACIEADGADTRRPQPS